MFPVLSRINRLLKGGEPLWFLVGNFIFFLAYTALICGCHFHADALLLALGPIALNSLGVSRGIKEKKKFKTVVWGCFLLVWIAFAWGSNVQFYFSV
jgi:hypothetical protein